MLSFIFLLGRCRSCGTSIPIRVPVVEMFMGLMALALMLKFHPPLFASSSVLSEILPAWIATMVFVFGLTVLALIDLDTYQLPHRLTIPLLAAGLLAAGLLPDANLADLALGALVGGGGLFVLIYVFFLVTGRLGMGIGDVVLLAVLGAWLGLSSLLFILMASSLQGLVGALIAYGLGHRKYNFPVEALAANETADPALSDGKQNLGRLRIPFGPFLALAGLEYLFYGETMMAWYWGGR